MSVTGKKEVLYNDRFAERLAYALFEANPCIKILFTRMPHEEISLKERVERLNSVENAWVVSIHHDSAQEQDLVKTGQIAGEDIWKTKTPLQGFSVFVSPQNLFYSASLELAKRIGRAMIRAGRKPSFYHAQPIKGEGREIADKEMGVFHHPEIAVLLKVRHPSALVEIGFLPDVKDEQLISTDAFIEKTTRSLAHELGRGFAPVKP